MSFIPLLAELDRGLLTFSEWVKIVAGLAAVGGGLLAAFKFLGDYKCDLELRTIEQEQREVERQQREDERTHHHINLARELLTTLFDDRLSRDALRLLDWEAREYPVGNQWFTITSRDVINGLRITADRANPRPDAREREMQSPGVDLRLNFTPEEQYVRDCFERLYDQFDSLEHFIRRGLLDIADLHTPLAYYVRKINAAPEQRQFLETYGYKLTLAFLARPLPPET